jgi:hypothetical protein
MELAVGDSTYVELIFATGHYKSRVSKNARIMCNSANNAPRLSFSAHPVAHPDSLELFVLSPFQLDLDSDRPEDQREPWQYEIAFRNVSEEKFEIAMIAPPAGEGITIDLPAGEIEPGQQKMITVKIDPSLADDLFNRSLTIEATDEQATRYTLPIQKKMRWGPAPITASR